MSFNTIYFVTKAHLAPYISHYQFVSVLYNFICGLDSGKVHPLAWMITRAE